MDISFSGDRHVYVDDGVVILDVQESDAGQYMCRAQIYAINGVGGQIQQWDITVNVKGKAIRPTSGL